MRSATMHARAVEDAIEGLAPIRLIERRARDRREHPVRKRSTDGEPGGALSASPQPERGGQLMRQVHASSLMILWRRQDAAYEVLLHLHEAPLPIEITPLEGEEFTGAHTSAQAAEQPWHHSGNRRHATATTCAASSRVNGSMTGSGSSALRRYRPRRSAGFAGSSSS